MSTGLRFLSLVVLLLLLLLIFVVVALGFFFFPLFFWGAFFGLVVFCLVWFGSIFSRFAPLTQHLRMYTCNFNDM